MSAPVILGSSASVSLAIRRLGESIIDSSSPELCLSRLLRIDHLSHLERWLRLPQAS
jgi:hypothetical protein